MRYILLFMILSVNSLSSYAQPGQFIRPVCIPESRYFRIDFLSVDFEIFNGDLKKSGKIFQKWQRRGIYDTSKLKYDCVLPAARYGLRVFRDPYRQDGQCAQAPRINISVLRNGLPMLKELPYGDDCYGALAVRSMEVRPWGDSGIKINLCLAYAFDTDAKCVELDPAYAMIGDRSPDGEQYKHAPLDKDNIDALIEKKFPDYFIR
jgi:hypothetical protein